MFSSKIGLLLVAITTSLFSTSGKCEPPPSSSYGTPLSAPISSYGTPNYSVNNIHDNNNNNGDHNNHGEDHGDHGEPKSYEFGYQVKDDYSGNNYNRKESSDGNQVRGEYRVQLPDGRTQIVTYYADWKTGFHADVRYEGTAQYPDQYNTYQGNNNNNNNGGGGGGGYQYQNNNGLDNSNQYASNNNNYNNNYNNGYNGGSSSSSNNYNGGYNYNNNNNGGGYDSYNTGNFGSNNKRPGYEYGAPA